MTDIDAIRKKHEAQSNYTKNKQGDFPYLYQSIHSNLSISDVDRLFKELDAHIEIGESLMKEVKRLDKELDKMQKWVNDLQSGMYINCVYCGHRYGPKDKVPDSMAEVLRRHIEKCPKHPMSKLKKELDALKRKEQVLYDIHEYLGVKWGQDPYHAIDTIRKEMDEARGKVEAARKWIRGARWVELEEIIFGKEGA